MTGGPICTGANQELLGELSPKASFCREDVEMREAMSCAGQDHPRWTGHGAEFWQNVVPWRREWQTTQYSCFENLINSIKRQKDILGNS